MEENTTIIAKQKVFEGFKCGKCGYPVKFLNDDTTTTLCFTCGVKNDRPSVDEENKHGWLPCDIPEGFEWEQPSGIAGPDVPLKDGKDGLKYIDYDRLVALPMSAQVIYKDAFAKDWTRGQWIIEKNEDPATVMKRMRNAMKKQRPVIVLG